MSSIIDVVNKIMQISGEMNTLRSCQLSWRFQREKCFIFEIYNTVNLWGSKRTRSINNSYLARACHSSLFLLEDYVD